MSGLWYVRVPEAGTNYVLNPSAEMPDNYGGLFVGSPSTSLSPSGSASPSASQSRSPSASVSASASQSRSPSASASISPSASASRSPSASASGTPSGSPSPSFGIAAVARVVTRARFGVRCYQVTTVKPYDGLWLGLSTLSNADHYASLYLYATDAVTPEVSLDGRAFHAASIIGGRAGGWVRYGVSIPASEASGSQRLDIRIPTEADFFVDAVQVEANDYGTTYIDGSLGDGYRWTGLYHASSSTRSAQVRAGGRERNLLDDYAIEVVDGTKHIGVPPITNQLFSASLLPGAIHQGVRVLPREIELYLHYTVEDAGSQEDTWAALSAKRAQVFDLFKPDSVSGDQPVTIGYAGPGSDRRVYAGFFYNGGMEGFSDLLHVDEIAPIKLLAADPFWYADDQQTFDLDYRDSLTANYGLARINGQWQALGTGFNSTVRAIAVDRQRGRVYFGGDFTHANGVLVNRICYWDGTTFRALGQGVTPNGVYAIAVAPNGDVWVGGDFTTVGGSSSQNYLARWNIATSTWTSFGAVIPTGSVFALAVDHAGLVYVGGNFSNWNANANADNVVTYDGSSWSALSTGADDVVNSIAVSANNDVYLAGAFANIGGVSAARVARWNGSAFSALGSGVNDVARALSISSNGDLYVGGSFTTAGGSAIPYIARWNGSAWSALGSGINELVRSLTRSEQGELYACGGFTAADGLTIADRIAGWNGSGWYHLDADLPGAPFTTSGCVLAHGQDLYLGLDTAGAALVSGLSTVDNDGTLDAFTRLSVINANTSGSATLQWLENQSTGHRLYFDLTVQAGETVTFDLTSTRKLLTSDWAGQITDNPLAASDVVHFKLLPGENRLGAFVTGTITNLSMLLHWTPAYWSADGASA